MAGNLARKTGKKNRKWNRNKLFCIAYRNEGRREKNKLRRALRHFAKHPNDVSAASCVGRLQ